MTLPKDIRTLADALYRVGYQSAGNRDYDPRGTDEWCAIVDEVSGLHSSLAAADALLRDIKDWDVNQAQGTCLMVPHNLRQRIAAHLSENTP